MLFSKNKKTIDVMVVHVETTVQCIKTAGMAVETYFDGDLSEAADLALQADALALDADHKMRGILNGLCRGSVVAPLRENLYLLANNFNKAAETAASCSLFFLDRRPEIPHSFRRDFLNISKTTFGQSPEIKKGAVNCLKGGWRQEKVCEFAVGFESARREFNKTRRDINQRIAGIGEVPWQQVILGACMMELVGVFDRMAFTVETITRINLQLGN